MCKIFINPLNKLFDKSELEQAYNGNPHGTGLYYWDKKAQKAHVLKWPEGTDFSLIWKTVSQLPKHKNVGLVALHFRFATSQCRTLDQVHPVQVRKDLWLMHNGFVHNFNVDPETVSDTQCLAWWFRTQRYNLESITFDILDHLNEKFAGNKLVLIEKNDFVIINESLGKWTDGIWRSWKPYDFSRGVYNLSDIEDQDSFYIDETGQARLFNWRG